MDRTQPRVPLGPTGCHSRPHLLKEVEQRNLCHHTTTYNLLVERSFCLFVWVVVTKHYNRSKVPHSRGWHRRSQFDGFTVVVCATTLLRVRNEESFPGPYDTESSYRPARHRTVGTQTRVDPPTTNGSPLTLQRSIRVLEPGTGQWDPECNKDRYTLFAHHPVSTSEPGRSPETTVIDTLRPVRDSRETRRPRSRLPIPPHR